MNYSSQKIDAPSYPLISAIVLSYNRREDLQRTLTNLLQDSYPSLEIIVVDNASIDNSGEMVHTDFPTVKLIQLNTNIGIAGWNEGMKVASGEYFLCLDDDSYPLSDSLQKILPSLCSTKILSLKIVTPSGQLDSPYFDTSFQQRTFIGCGVIIPKYIYKTIGGFNQTLFIYQHELDYSIRAIDKGFSIQYVPEAIVCHSRSRGNREIQNGRDRRVMYYMTRNSLIIVLQYFSLQKIIGRIARILLGRLSFAVFSGTFLITVKAIIDGLNQGWKYRNSSTIVSRKTQEFYEYGKYAGSFFCDGLYGFKRPKFLNK